ncbi:MAG: addiction module toxin RelE [Betaproteobacteria bacterium RIFCSPLOWO2_12_FULL_62_58]|nr:MAG: addiction module toxin RelE [Betaproteobacteria bacterium RIFCSPLOWO2_12_FULL_62_58]
MKLVGREILEEFIVRHADTRGPIASWFAEAEAAIWETPHDIKARYATASFLSDNTVIFNIKGDSYRLETQIAYKTSVVIIVWAGTHAEYSKR